MVVRQEGLQRGLILMIPLPETLANPSNLFLSLQKLSFSFFHCHFLLNGNTKLPKLKSHVDENSCEIIWSICVTFLWLGNNSVKHIGWSSWFWNTRKINLRTIHTEVFQKWQKEKKNTPILPEYWYHDGCMHLFNFVFVCPNSLYFYVYTQAARSTYLYRQQSLLYIPFTLPCSTLPGSQKDFLVFFRQVHKSRLSEWLLKNSK